MSGEALELCEVGKSFGRHAALHDVSLVLRPDRYTCIMGPSGSGKSTLLRILGGHERPDAGRVLLGARDVTAWPAERRPLHTVFQEHALFPFLSVLDNVAFSARMKGVERSAREARAHELLELVHMTPYAQRLPAAH